ncbi:hypothetical protein BRD18_04805 [Halobacteriales archaeon SW_7_71_33]|nr:MAG: hypothetical protein BRD18_04805 [Halobacteriales archaeon SW_7_71_33]
MGEHLADDRRRRGHQEHENEASGDQSDAPGEESGDDGDGDRLRLEVFPAAVDPGARTATAASRRAPARSRSEVVGHQCGRRGEVVGRQHGRRGEVVGAVAHAAGVGATVGVRDRLVKLPGVTADGRQLRPPVGQ